ncbi:MAG: GAD-like domain-containing protein, partial [Clostridium sp.]
MNDDLFKEYKIDSKVESNLIDKYKEVISEELISVWKIYGFGSILNGYLKIINPDEYKEIIDNSYFRANVSIPIFATAFGDIITWEKNEYVSIIKYKNGTFDIILKRFKHFFNCLQD